MQVEIVGLGECCVDFFISVEDFCPVDDKIWILKTESHPGGVTANFCVAVAKLGIKSGFMGSAGDDADGQFIYKNFARRGVDTKHFFLDRNKKSPVNFIIVNKRGERQILQSPDLFSNALLPNEINPEYISAAKFLHTSAVRIEAAHKAMEYAKEYGVNVSFDLERHVAVMGLSKLQPLLQMTDILLPNKLGALELSKEKDLGVVAKKFLNFGPKVVVITLGEKGCLVTTEDEQYRVPAFKVKAIDTTGAGDAFNASFIVALYKGMKLEDVAEFANAVAALKCTRMGAQSSPSLGEVEAFLSKKPERLL